MKKYKTLYKKAKETIRNLEIELDRERSKKEFAEYKANEYKKRFREFGSNVHTVNPGDGKLLTAVTWELHGKAFGDYTVIDRRLLPVNPAQKEVIFEQIKERMITNIVTGLVESNLVQIIMHDGIDSTPFDDCGTIAAKLFVIPWEQVPHNRTIELRQYVENSLEWMEGVEDGKL